MAGQRRTKLSMAVAATALALGVGGLGALNGPVAAAPDAPPSPAAVVAASPRATLSFVGAPIGQSKSGTVNLTPGVAKFSPANKGAKVKIQRKKGGKWRTVASGRQNGKGQLAFLAAVGSAKNTHKFRARSVRNNGRALISRTVRPGIDDRVFNDDFGGSSLNSSWAFRDVRVAKRACSPPDRRMTSVGGGKLTLTVAKDGAKSPNVTRACPDGQYLNSMIGSQGRKQYRYGIFAARLKYPAAQGAHGSFWLQTPGGAPGAKPWDVARSGTEIDVTEYFGDGFKKDGVTGGLYSFVYVPQRTSSDGVRLIKTPDRPLTSARKAFRSGQMPSDGYHVYSVEWTPKQYIFRVDGVETLRLNKGVSQISQYMILSLLSSDWELPKMNPRKLPMSLKVDWVRVWQK